MDTSVRVNVGIVVRFRVYIRVRLKAQSYPMT